MASAQAKDRRHKGTRAGGWYPLPLEDVAEALQATRSRTLRRDCLESRDRAYRWCVRKCKAEGPSFRSTLMQAAKGMGYALTDDDEQNFRSWKSSVHRCLNDLQAAGLIQFWGGVKHPNGKWRCIEVCMPLEAETDDQRTIISGRGSYAPRNSALGRRETHPRAPRTVSRPRLARRRRLTPDDRRDPHRPASTARRVFFAEGKMASPEGVTPPTGELTPRRSFARTREGAQPSFDRGCAAADEQQGWTPAGPAPGSREGPGPAGAAPGELPRGGEPGASRAGPQQDRVPAARAAYLARFEELFGSMRAARFSHRRWGERLDQALARLDRYADFGAGRRGGGLDYAIGVMEGEAERGDPDSGVWDPRWQPPASPAYFVPLLEEVSKTWRRQQARRTREAPPGWRGSWVNPKEKKGRRAEVRSRAPTDS